MSDQPPSATLLVIDDDAEIRYSMHRVLASRGYTVHSAGSGEEGLELAEREKPDVIFLDNRMAGITGIETLQHLRSINPRFMVVLMTAFGTTQTAIEAMKFGAFDYIVKPFDVERVLALTRSALKSCQDLVEADREYRPLLDSEDYQEGIVGSSEAMREVFKMIGQVAASEATVLVTGESGTGKELVARCLRQHSHRHEGPFLAVNCAAIPETLIESELFGHERGAFTGATNQRVGSFEQCDGGTIFLDEIGDMALATQTKILRALQDGDIQRVGGTGTIKVDVRLVAATNKDLEAMVRAGEFREDLYYRLNVVRLHLPPLRERMEDVPELIDYMLQRMGKKGKTGVKRVSNEALAALQAHRWPGNVRELENVISRSAVLAQGETILLKDLPPEVTRGAESAKAKAVPAKPDGAGGDGAAAAPAEVEGRTGAAASEKRPAATAPSATAASGPVVADAPGSASPGAAAAGDTFGEIGWDESFDIAYRAVRRRADKAILQVVEKELIQRALNETGGNQVKTAALLGITRATLRKRIDQYGLKY